jgi:Fe-S cluster assembly protein SufD
MSAVQAWVDDFAARAQGLPGANVPWLAGVRQRAIQRFADIGWPTTREDAWRHTSLATLAQQSFVAPGHVSAAELVTQVRQGEPGHWLIFVDGRYAPELSDVGTLPAGVEIKSLAQALVDQPDQVQALFGDETDGASTASLNAALAADGAYVRLSRGVAVEHPVHLVFVAASDQAASFPRNIIYADAAANATIVEHYVGQGGGATFTNTVTRAFVSADAHISHIKLQQESPQAFHLAAIDVQQESGSVYNSHSMSFGARLARNDISTSLNGQRCETLLNGLYYVDGRRHVDHHTLINHAQPFCNSHEYYRGILADTARGVFSGRILVAPGADKTDAIQRSDSLLLSRMAKADARPELEIYADDVKCAHGATVGQIDEDSLFYLRSRGLDDELARNVLTYGFAATALQRIQLDSLRKRATVAIRSLLPGGSALGELE